MKPNIGGYFYLFITVVFFSTYEVVSKTLVGIVDPFQINFIRFFIGGVFLSSILLINRDYKISRKDLFYVLLLGIINVVVSMNLLQFSLYIKDAKASVAAVIFSSNPIFVTAFSAMLEKEKIPLYKVAGLLVGIAGIFTIFMEKLNSGITDFKSPLLALLSALFFAVYTVIGRRVSVRIGSLKMNSYSFILGSLCLLPILLLSSAPVFTFDSSGIPQVIYLSIFATGIAYLSYFKGLSLVGASSGSLIYFIKPVLASFIAILFLKESASVNLLTGTIMIISGITVIIYWTQIKEKITEKIKEFKNN